MSRLISFKYELRQNYCGDKTGSAYYILNTSCKKTYIDYIRNKKIGRIDLTGREDEFIDDLLSLDILSWDNFNGMEIGRCFFGLIEYWRIAVDFDEYRIRAKGEYELYFDRKLFHLLHGKYEARKPKAVPYYVDVKPYPYTW